MEQFELTLQMLHHKIDANVFVMHLLADGVLNQRWINETTMIVHTRRATLPLWALKYAKIIACRTISTAPKRPLSEAEVLDDLS